MDIKFSFNLRMGLEGGFVKQSVPACMSVKGFKKAVEPKGCLNNYDFYKSRDSNVNPRKMKLDDIFGPGDYISVVERN